jgi:beta-lactamase regulating signal transducer with metallopeptidase domain
MKQKIVIIAAISVVAGIIIGIVVMIVRRRLIERRCSESLAKAINECNRKLQNKPEYDFSSVRVIKDDAMPESDEVNDAEFEQEPDGNMESN